MPSRIRSLREDELQRSRSQLLHPVEVIEPAACKAAIAEEESEPLACERAQLCKSDGCIPFAQVHELRASPHQERVHRKRERKRLEPKRPEPERAAHRLSQCAVATEGEQRPLPVAASPASLDELEVESWVVAQRLEALPSEGLIASARVIQSGTRQEDAREPSYPRGR